MNSHEVVIHEVQRDGMPVVVDLLRERIRQSREAAHTHSHREILALDVARGDVRLVGVSGDGLLRRASANGRAVTLLAFRRVPGSGLV